VRERLGAWIFAAAITGMMACDAADAPTLAASSAAATASASSTPEPSAEPAAAVLTGPCCYGAELAPGRYVTPSWFGTPFSIEVSDGFFGVGAELERIVLLGRGESRAGNLERYVGFFVAASADALLRQLRATPRTTQGPVSETTVGSIPARVFDAEAHPNPDTPPSDEIVPGAIRIPAIDRLVPTFFYAESARARMRFVVVDLGDRALLIYVESPARRFASFDREVAPMLESIRLLS